VVDLTIKDRCVYLLKGLLYSGFVWFGTYAITIAFKVPNLTTVTSATWAIQLCRSHYLRAHDG